MSTTAIFVEILIIGMQTTLWIMLLIIGITGPDWVVNLKINPKDWMNLIIILYFALSYTCGIVVDRISDFSYNILEPKKILLSIDYVKTKYEEAHQDQRMKILSSEGKSIEFINYIRSRIRIVRATLFNLLFGVPSALFFILNQGDAIASISKWNFFYTTLGVGVASVIVTFTALGMLNISYDNRMKQINLLLEEEED